MEWEILAVLFGMAFSCGLVDSTLGMAYGTTLTPVLLFMGYEPMQVVPAILLSELVTGAFSAFAHHRAGNAFFNFRNNTEHRIVKKASWDICLDPKTRKLPMFLGSAV